MGVIKKQTILGTVLTYVGVGLGFLATAIIQPRLLSTAYIGVLSMLHTYSNIASSLLDQGLVAATLRNFTFFENKEKRHHGYFVILVLGFIVAMFVTTALYVLFNEEVKIAGGTRSELLARYAIWLLPLTASVSMYNLMDGYLRGLKDAVSGTLYKEVIQRLLVLGAYAGLYFSFLSFDLFVASYVLAFAVPAILILMRVFRRGGHAWKLDTNHFSGQRRTDFLKVLGYGALLGVGGTLVRDVDRWMIKDMLGLSETGIYSIAWYFGFVISIPARALNRIAITVLADSWKEGRLDEIERVYKSSCVNQTLVGGVLFLGLCLNLEIVFEILPDEFRQGKWTIIFIAMSQLVNMATGANTSILSTSKHYKWGAYFLALLVVLVIVGNYLLIPVFGISGAALASAIALFIFNALKLLFLRWKYQLQPFGVDLIKCFLLIGVTGGIVYFIPSIAHNVWVNFLIRGSLIVGIYAFGAYALKIDAAALGKFKRT